MAKKNLILFILMFMVFTGCSRISLTPVASPPTGVHHQGKFVWHDLLTTDVAAAKDFYGNLLGWSFREQGRYTVVLNGDKAIGGMVHIKPKDGKKHASRWLASLSVPDIEKAANYVKESGGTIHEGPVEMKNRGRGLLISDPQKAQILLLNSIGGDPADIEPAMGSWLWVELWSDAPEKSIAFYKELGDYDAVKGDNEYWFLWHDKWRAGVRKISKVPLDDAEVRWIPTVRVTDTKSTSSKARKLGGQVLVEPREISIGGSVALIEDPNGALLIIQSWSPQSEGGKK